ncbi:MAG: CDP-alcohol phosphatidyltransferase family protein, partial [Proteobacteria bacterium]|nr:CDP-alcohol phosphatidyltransferase family protein [Pseudomonadota bacterium]
MKGAKLPNAVTGFRLILIPLFAYVLINNLLVESVIVFIIMCTTDILDGYLSRKLGVDSNWGAYFDVITD